jgi:hypothetical protein
VITFENGAIEVDARLVGEGLGIDPALVPALMREGAITSICERGMDDDAGRYRLTFFYEGRRLRIVIDAEGTVLQRSLLDLGERARVPRGPRSV